MSNLTAFVEPDLFTHDIDLQISDQPKRVGGQKPTRRSTLQMENVECSSKILGEGGHFLPL
ncbi:hypothetical protein ACPOL_3777 [Acidisarcina polymorpha]|uniref:Uncharacterized protein n=1 Tax=Acidisarcina polymorpha TaxID=2211140 RepID=A0A2Z5G3F3_9BACT|nr:hypothetical protein ACPOL_3777 [Acidisarcina polymorpha]